MKLVNQCDLAGEELVFHHRGNDQADAQRDQHVEHRAGEHDQKRAEHGYLEQEARRQQAHAQAHHADAGSTE